MLQRFRVMTVGIAAFAIVYVMVWPTGLEGWGKIGVVAALLAVIVGMLRWTPPDI